MNFVTHDNILSASTRALREAAISVLAEQRSGVLHSTDTLNEIVRRAVGNHTVNINPNERIALSNALQTDLEAFAENAAPQHRSRIRELYNGLRAAAHRVSA